MADENWTVRDVLDQMRSWYGKNVKPFEKMPEVFEAAQRVIDQELPAAKRELEGLSHFIADLRAELPALEAEVKEAHERSAVTVKESREAEDAARRALADSEARATEREAALTKEYDAKRAQAETELSGYLTALRAEITELTKSKTALEGEVAALRKKFAAF